MAALDQGSCRVVELRGEVRHRQDQQGHRGVALASRQGLGSDDIDLPQSIDVELDAGAIGFDQDEQAGHARPTLPKEVACTRQLAQPAADGAPAGAELHLDDALGHAARPDHAVELEEAPHVGPLARR